MFFLGLLFVNITSFSLHIAYVVVHIYKKTLNSSIEAYNMPKIPKIVCLFYEFF